MLLGACVLRLVLGPNMPCSTRAMDPRCGETCGETPSSLCALLYHFIFRVFVLIFVGWTGGAWSGFRPGEWLAVAALEWEQFWCITRWGTPYPRPCACYNCTALLYVFTQSAGGLAAAGRVTPGSMPRRCASIPCAQPSRR